MHKNDQVISHVSELKMNEAQIFRASTLNFSSLVLQIGRSSNLTRCTGEYLKNKFGNLLHFKELNLDIKTE